MITMKWGIELMAQFAPFNGERVCRQCGEMPFRWRTTTDGLCERCFFESEGTQ